MKIGMEILQILSACSVVGNTVILPDIQLDRPVYLAVNKCLENIGGKWNRKQKGHVFNSDPSEKLEILILTGETEDTKKKFQFFPTPETVAEYMCDLAELSSGLRVLEPSCGDGRLADVIIRREDTLLLTGIEINPDMAEILMTKSYSFLVGCDFLEVSAEEDAIYDRVIMNPPFSRQQDIRHIRHAYDFLASGGILISVISQSPFFRDNQLATDFRDWLNGLNAEVFDLESGSFKESGTMIETRLLKIIKL